jgi:uncharacterized protein
VLDLEDFSYTDGDVDTNRSDNGSIHEIIKTRYSRRAALFGGVAAAMLPGFVLSGCGEGEAAPAASIQVSAGDVTASAGRVVTLTGSATGATPTSFAWTQISGPPVTLSSSTTATTTFVAPAVAAQTPLQFQFAAAADGTSQAALANVTVGLPQIGFTAVPKSLADVVTVPAGYNVAVLYRLGDPINAATPAYVGDGSDDNFAARAGDHHDGMYYFGLSATGNAPDPTNNTRGILCINHENITESYLHPNGVTLTGGVRPFGEVVKEIECHGVSVIEVTRAGASGAWSYVQSSALNRRITPFTPMAINGPARGNAQLRTAYSPDATAARGTVNNCANGFTPWNTYLTCEENWAGYFRRNAGDQTARTAAGLTKSNTSLARYGVGGDGARAGANGWTTATPVPAGDTRFARLNISIDPTKPLDGSGDYRNEINQYGWVVEIDPFDPASVPRKRTALGRMGHEGAWPGRFVAGVKPAWYMGDDAAGDYCYKFVSSVPWAAADATATNRLAIGDKYLDAGTLYVAKFNADGSGQWLPLVFGTGPITAANPAYAFADQADVLINARLAGDAVGATKMDRPEWTAVNPKTGEMYLTLTNGPTRNGTTLPTDAANPRVYVDPPSTTRTNRNGHILRLKETGETTEATTFTWDIYVFAAGSDLDPANINISGLTADNDMSSPDGLWFSRSQNAGGVGTPLLWIQTDDGAFTDQTNCMMLVGQPGVVGDGGTKTITNTLAGGVTATQTTRIGALPGTTLRRFLVGPKGSEITGIDSTPDGRTVFVNIQHPGETGSATVPVPLPSNWPATQAGAAAPTARPRSATIVITKNDGGVVGV